jgi:hypothetical protein
MNAGGQGVTTRRGRLLPILIVAALVGWPAALRAQVFELQGGGSSLHQGYGGALNVWGDRYEGNVGIGYLDGVRFSVFLKRLIGKDTLRLGNDAIPVRFATDVFGGSQALLAQGGGIRRATRRSQLRAFVGASANATPAPFVNALRHDRIIGVVQGERQLSPTVRTTTHALFSTRQTVLQGVEWKLPNGIALGSSAGIGGNQPYGAASFSFSREAVDVRASYVGMGDRFRRTGVPSTVQSEADRENLLVTLRPASGFSFGIGRQNFRQDSTLPGVADRATLNHVFGSARLVGTNLSAGVFDSRTPGSRNLSSYASATRDLTRWLQTDVYVLQVWAPTTVKSTTPVVRLREFISPRLSLLQVVTHANGRTSVAMGGAFASGLTTLGLDYQVVHTPYRRTQPFVQTMALTVRLPLGNYRVNASSFVAADGRVNYSGSASTFFYAGDALSGASKPVELRFERFIVEGTVVDESGVPVDGAAIAIGGTTVFTDSRGRFFVRGSSSRAVPVRVAFDEFITDGQYELVSAPPTATPKRERDIAPIRVVLRRLSPERLQDAARDRLGVPVPPNE